ncbi:MAG: hypothetical protein H7Z13_08295, partial [Ferruginibacter sp.]|nr:hypothetical protein [Ferruginibacter sp.]
EIGYTLPVNVMRNIIFSSARFFINGTNLFSLDKVKYGDPESLTGYPVMRTFSIGAKIQM